MVKGGEEGIKPIKIIVSVESIHEVNYSGDVCGGIHPAGRRPRDIDATSADLSSSGLRMAAKNALFSLLQAGKVKNVKAQEAFLANARTGVEMANLN